jgi:hypothetical protein
LDFEDCVLDVELFFADWGPSVSCLAGQRWLVSRRGGMELLGCLILEGVHLGVAGGVGAGAGMLTGVVKGQPALRLGVIVAPIS